MQCVHMYPLHLFMYVNSVCVCWECLWCEFCTPLKFQRTKYCFETQGECGGLQVQPSIFLLLGGGRLFALGTLTIWPLNHFRVVELGGPSKAFLHTHPVLAQREVLCLIHSERQATGKGLPMPSSFAQSSSEWESKRRSISLVVWESQNSSKQTY
jgi:hypothetical protein